MENKTAVEFLFSELERCQYFIGNDIYQAYKEALEMEDLQILEARKEEYGKAIDAILKRFRLEKE
jgi:hypothetical protein